MNARNTLTLTLAATLTLALTGLLTIGCADTALQDDLRTIYSLSSGEMGLKDMQRGVLVLPSGDEVPLADIQPLQDEAQLSPEHRAVFQQGCAEGQYAQKAGGLTSSSYYPTVGSKESTGDDDDGGYYTEECWHEWSCSGTQCVRCLGCCEPVAGGKYRCWELCVDVITSVSKGSL